jgi:hypothetical protein
MWISARHPSTKPTKAVNIDMYRTSTHLASIMISDITHAMTVGNGHWFGEFEWRIDRTGKVLVAQEYYRTLQLPIDRYIDGFTFSNDESPDEVIAAIKAFHVDLEAEYYHTPTMTMFKRILSISPGVHLNFRGQKFFTYLMDALEEWSDSNDLCNYLMIKHVCNTRLREHLRNRSLWFAAAQYSFIRKSCHPVLRE